MTRRRPRRRTVTRVGSLVGVGLALSAALPATVLGHALNPTYTSRLPLAVYLAGAATTVALSFLFVLARDVRADARRGPQRARTCRRRSSASGCASSASSAWAWIVAQGIAGGASAATSRRCSCGSTAGSASRSSRRCVGPVWHFLDPFSTLHDLGAWVLRRLDVARLGAARTTRRGWAAGRRSIGFPVVRLARAGARWPAPSTLFVVLVGYTAFTLAMMAQFGRDTGARTARPSPSGSGSSAGWRRTRLADEDGRVRRRPFVSGLLEPGWATRGRRSSSRFGVGLDPVRRAVADAALVRPVRRARAAGEDAAAARLPGPDRAGRARRWRGSSGSRRPGPASCRSRSGYLIAHYLTYLLIDGQASSSRSPTRSSTAGTCSGRRSTSRRARGCRRASSGPSSSRPSSAATCSAPGRGHVVRGRGRAAGH